MCDVHPIIASLRHLIRAQVVDRVVNKDPGLHIDEVEEPSVFVVLTNRLTLSLALFPAGI